MINWAKLGTILYVQYLRLLTNIIVLEYLPYKVLSFSIVYPDNNILPFIVFLSDASFHVCLSTLFTDSSVPPYLILLYKMQLFYFRIRFFCFVPE
jgi:hypothetical protein